MRELTIHDPLSSAEVSALKLSNEEKTNSTVKFALYFIFALVTVNIIVDFFTDINPMGKMVFGLISYFVVGGLLENVETTPAPIFSTVDPNLLLKTVHESGNVDAIGFLLIIHSQERDITLVEQNFLQAYLSADLNNAEKKKKYRQLVEEATQLIEKS